jgi:hypothetical protein
VVFYDVLFDIPNPERELDIQMTAQVFIVLAQAKCESCGCASSARSQSPDEPGRMSPRNGRRAAPSGDRME